MNINLKLIHVFLLVAEHKSICRAAQVLNRSPSAVSMQIRQLELQLGVSLFHRTTRRVQLSREGELLLVSARQAVDGLQASLHEIRQSVDAEHGQLALACSPALTSTYLPEILAAFQKSNPGVTTHVHELLSSDIMESIRRQEVAFGIGARLDTAADFDFQPILRDEICALIPTNIAVVSGDTVSLADLCRMPNLMIAGTPAMRGFLDQMQKVSGFPLSVRYQVQQAQTQIAIANAGAGVAILSRAAVPATLNPRVRAVAIVDPALTYDLCVITLRGQSLSPLATRFVELLQGVMSRLDGGRQPAIPPIAARHATAQVRRQAALAAH